MNVTEELKQLRCAWNDIDFGMRKILQYFESLTAEEIKKSIAERLAEQPVPVKPTLVPKSNGNGKPDGG